MKKGTPVKLPDGTIGRIHELTPDGDPKSIRTVTGKVINVLDVAIEILSLIKYIIELLKNPIRTLFGF